MKKRDFAHNHYVPEWHQKRFLPAGQQSFFYHDLNPEVVTSNGHSFTRSDILRWGPPSCFAQDDLYTTTWGDLKNTDIERYFFGEIDSQGRHATEFFLDFSIKEGVHEAFENLVRYLSVQRLRTPKGLGYLAAISGTRNQNRLLQRLQELHMMHCAMWTDAVWQIADASASPTKFIISDNPVTLYNRGCFPGSDACRGFMDPDIREVATQTLFPISPEKVIILTNLAWVRDPYQRPQRIGPNDKLFHSTVMKLTDIQRGRMLSEEEVVQINYIIKKRALRYIAAAEREWLFPERSLSSTHWSKLGDGYLLMPEPRGIYMGGEVYMGFKGGRRSESWNEYGHRPWERGYKDDRRFEREGRTLERFKDEFAALYGPKWRGWSESLGNKGPREDDAEFYSDHVRGAAKYGIRARHEIPAAD